MKKFNLVDLRLQRDWNRFYEDKYLLDNFTIHLTPPLKSKSYYSISLYVSTSCSVFNDKPYQVYHPIN